jgi:hypothetical protein
MKAGTIVRLKKFWQWSDHSAKDCDYTVLAVREGCGSGTCVQVTPAVSPFHPDGESVWYDANHFEARAESAQSAI